MNLVDSEITFCHCRSKVNACEIILRTSAQCITRWSPYQAANMVLSPNGGAREMGGLLLVPFKSTQNGVISAKDAHIE